MATEGCIRRKGSSVESGKSMTSIEDVHAENFQRQKELGWSSGDTIREKATGKTYKIHIHELYGWITAQSADEFYGGPASIKQDWTGTEKYTKVYE